MRGKHATKFAMTVTMKYRNYKNRAKGTENKVKLSNCVLFSRCMRKFVILVLKNGLKWSKTQFLLPHDKIE